MNKLIKEGSIAFSSPLAGEGKPGLPRPPASEAGQGRGEGNNLAVLRLFFSLLLLVFTPLQSYAEQVYNIALKSGENLVVLPAAPKNTDIKVVLSAIINKVKDVWEFNPDDASDPWKHFRPGLEEYSDLKQMSSGKGYWINLKSDAVLQITGETQIQSPEADLKQGWNQIIWPYQSSLGITGALSGLTFGIDYDQVSSFNNATKTQENFLNQPESDNLTTFEPDKVYYIHMLDEKKIELSDPAKIILPEIANTVPQDKAVFYENDLVSISCAMKNPETPAVQYQFSIDDRIKQTWSEQSNFIWIAVPCGHKIKIEAKNNFGQDTKEIEIYVFIKPIAPPE